MVNLSLLRGREYIIKNAKKSVHSWFYLRRSLRNHLLLKYEFQFSSFQQQRHCFSREFFLNLCNKLPHFFKINRHPRTLTHVQNVQSVFKITGRSPPEENHVILLRNSIPDGQENQSLYFFPLISLLHTQSGHSIKNFSWFIKLPSHVRFKYAGNVRPVFSINFFLLFFYRISDHYNQAL